MPPPPPPELTSPFPLLAGQPSLPRRSQGWPHYGRLAIMALALIGFVVPVLWYLARLPETPPSRAHWILLTISAVLNVAVIAFHYLVPAHPKFLILPGRFAVLLVHIVSGSVELAAGLIACFAASPNAAIVQACAALFFHVPSALLQIPTVFGSKAIMYPAYLLSIILHAFCAAMLLTRPDSQMWAVNTFLVFNIYTWVRFYFYVFDRLKLFATMKYTVAIFAAGVTMLPGLLGSMTMLVLTGFVITYILLQRLLFIRTPAEYLDFVREKSREGVVAPEMAAFWGGLVAQQDEAKVARAYFDSLARDAQGGIAPAELVRVLAPWGLAAGAIHTYAERLLAGGPVTFDRFLTQVWNIGAVRSRGAQIVLTEQAASERDKAELVFRYADANRDGVVTVEDLDVLLVEWGLPAAEARRYLVHADQDGDGKISFDEFFHRMRPLWRFIFFEVFRAQLNRRGTDDLIGRSAMAIHDRHRTSGLRRRVERELLSRVPFLANATPELIDDLAASLVKVSLRAGDGLFAEGDAGDRFYIVSTGMIRVSRQGTALADLATGGCVGEGALLSAEPRNATVTVLADTDLFALTRSSFQYLTEKYPAVLERLRALHANRQLLTNVRTIQDELMGRVPFLRGAGQELIYELASNLVARRFVPGEVVFKQGDAGDTFYIIEEGGIDIIHNGVVIDQHEVGGCFGEGALFSSQPRTATALARESTRLLGLKREAFNSILEHFPAMRNELMSLHAARRKVTDGPAR